MKIRPRDNIINKAIKIGDIPNADLRKAYEGIVEFKNTGIIPDDLYNFYTKLGDKIREITKTKDNWFRDIEDMLLFEMARRYYNKEI